jgi:penicillin-binding protein 1A
VARHVLRAFAIVLVTGLVVPVATAGTVLAAFLFLPLPASVPEPQRTIEAAVSRVYDIEGNEIGQFRRFDAREPVQPGDIPQVLKDAVVSAEDRRFYEHGGVDLRGTLRALWADIRAGGAVQGGSTITQQYVKNAYVGSDRSLTRKVREAVLASQLDRQYEKDEILFRYLDQVYLGEGAYGVGAASETYFRKPVSQLSLSEAALLTGIIPAPSRYEPRGHAENAERKRVIVLDAMLRNGKISPEQHAEAVQQRIHLAVFGPPPEGQPVTVVHPRETPFTSFPYFVDYVRSYLERRYGDDIVYRRGLDIYTTMDQRIQSAAQEEIAATTEGMPDGLQMALAAVEPGSGYVKAIVGGRDFDAPGGQVNIAVPGGGGSGRQPGSGYKPFVLAAALEQGVSPGKTYSGRSGICFDATYCPQNYGNASYGNLDLREATKRSVNSIYVQLIRDVGVQATMDLAKKHGLSLSNYDPDRHFLSVALGAEGAFPLEMASAYGTWAARGERATPTPVLRVLDRDGNVLEDNVEPRKERVVSEVTADTMNEILQGVFTPGGTARGRGIEAHPAAGKTGTTNDNKDAWFNGYTTHLSASVWIGYRQPEEMENIKGVRSVTGGTFPAQTWQRFMQRVHADLPVVDFTEPAPITPVADDAKREARRGFEPGSPRRPSGTDDGGAAEEELPPPTVEPPPEPTSTTTTTQPGIDLGGGAGDDGEDAGADDPFP